MNMVQLENKPTPQLLELYNQAATQLRKPKVNRFADRKTALRRTAAPAPAVEEKGGARKRETRMTFEFKPKGTIKPLREGTKRHLIYKTLLRGATFEQVLEVVQEFDKENPPAHPRTPEKLRSFGYEAIRLLHLYSGYGLRQEGDKIFVYGGD